MRDFLIDIPSDDPFGNDVFGRDIIAENFMKIFELDEDGIVVAIDSDWGTGKTTFIKMWESLIINDYRYKEKYYSIYFNAWDNDYLEDPLVAILTEMKLKEKSEEGQENVVPKIFKEIFNPICLVAKRGADIALKLGTAGAIGVNEFKIKEDDTQDKILDKMNEIGNEVLNRCVNARMIRDEFKENISNITKNYNKKLIFFIDELDRCRPSFAIELLETIKHLFSVPGVIFVVSLDKQQLSHSVATIYGQNMDTDGYLRRFFDIDYKLANANKSKYMEIKNEITLNKYNNTKYLEYFLDGFVRGFNLSLRDIDKMHKYMEIIMPLISEYKSSNKEKFRIIIVSYLYAYLIVLKIKRSDLYNKIMTYDYKYDIDTYEESFELNDIYSIDFGKERLGLSKSVIYTIQEQATKNFLLLNHLSNIKPEEIYKSKKNSFTIETQNAGWSFNMENLFDSTGYCEIKSNLEFMNRLQ